MRIPDGWRIEPTTGRLVRVVGTECSVLEFMARLSEAEQLALAALRRDPNTPLMLGAALDLMQEQRDNTTNKRINLRDPRVRRGAEIALTALAGLPEGTPGRVDPATVAARIEAWLADYPQPGEGVS